MHFMNIVPNILKKITIHDIVTRRCLGLVFIQCVVGKMWVSCCCPCKDTTNNFISCMEWLNKAEAEKTRRRTPKTFPK